MQHSKYIYKGNVMPTNYIFYELKKEMSKSLD